MEPIDNTEEAVSKREAVKELAAAVIPPGIEYDVYLRDFDHFFNLYPHVHIRFYSDDGRKLIFHLDPETIDDMDVNREVIAKAVKVWQLWAL